MGHYRQHASDLPRAALFAQDRAALCVMPLLGMTLLCSFTTAIGEMAALGPNQCENAGHYILRGCREAPHAF